ncbi:uncharacterized protein C8Q71DRAFT_208140 [Rhodofomes roseus]|uniref:F-box domain-containing protein n=1 Tax=Rhodofomes roseus TaxID=34475 RepID=A0ABQ8KTZ3_9APHY|nr:uncharacterized protein C8Q71DRAFT_208140 [Rhodofomes roseus]KAH9842553.1 hypothetical protein C8Q71DRAFT_208140 [Rhodofomes roseus]
MDRKFPNELTDDISDCLRDDPRTLLSCALTCRDWLSRSRRHLWEYHKLVITSVADLAFLSDRLARPENKQFYSDKDTTMQIREDETRPFAHTVPLRIPGSFLPRLESTKFSHIGTDLGDHSPRINWHNSFFQPVLSSYKAVTRLKLSNCHFHVASILRRLLYALPALRAATLVT